MRKAREPFFTDLRYALNPERYHKEFTQHSVEKAGLEQYNKAMKPDFQLTDSVFNVNHGWEKTGTVHDVYSSEPYRYDELEAFILLCKELEIEATFIVGPANDALLKQKAPEYLKGRQAVNTKVRELLNRHEADYIDCSDIGTIPGTFADEVHNSSYGGWLIYERLKAHILEKRN